MTIFRGLFVYRLRQFQITDDGCRTQVEQLRHLSRYLRIAHRYDRRAVCVHIQRYRFRYTDRVTHLNQCLVRYAGGYQMLRDPACGISSRTVHFRRILTAERTAAVSTATTIGVHDDLTTRQTRVAVRTADHEITRRVHQQLRILVCQELMQQVAVTAVTRRYTR